MSEQRVACRAGVSGSTLSRRTLMKSALGAALVLPLYGALPRLGRAEATYDYYIGPSGVDNNPGTRTSPWSLMALETKPEIAGKRVGLLPGTYVLSTRRPYGDGSNYNVKVNYGGTASAPTLVAAVEPRRAVFTHRTGNGYPGAALRALYVVNGVGHFHFRDLKFQNCAGGIGINCSDVVIEGCHFEDIDSQYEPAYPGDNFAAIWIYGVIGDTKSNITVRNCLFDGVFNSAGKSYSGNACAVGLYYAHNLTVEQCTIRNTHSLCYPKNYFGNYVFRYNFVHNTREFMRTTFSGEEGKATGRNRIHNNLVLGGAVSGEYDFYTWTQDTDFFNNTIVRRPSMYTEHNRYLWRILVAAASPTKTVRVFNNIMYRPAPTAYVNHRDLIFDDNFYSQPGQDYRRIFSLMDFNAFSDSTPFEVEDAMRGAVYKGLDAWRAASGFETHSIRAFPGFVSLEGDHPEDFRLQAGSACVGAGRQDGSVSGVPDNIGCWSRDAVQIGHSFGPLPLPPNVAID